MWQALFAVTNAAALGGWLLLIAGPRRTLLAVRVGVVGLLCLIYTGLFVSLLAGWMDPVRSGPEPSLADYSVRGLRGLFASDGGVVVGWTHYLALDLFAGCWIAEDAGRRGVGRLPQAPVLLATFLAGPAGLLAWLIVRHAAGVERGRETG